MSRLVIFFHTKIFQIVAYGDGEIHIDCILVQYHETDCNLIHLLHADEYAQWLHLIDSEMVFSFLRCHQSAGYVSTIQFKISEVVGDL